MSDDLLLSLNPWMVGFFIMSVFCVFLIISRHLHDRKNGRLPGQRWDYNTRTWRNYDPPIWRAE